MDGCPKSILFIYNSNYQKTPLLFPRSARFCSTQVSYIVYFVVKASYKYDSRWAISISTHDILERLLSCLKFISNLLRFQLSIAFMINACAPGSKSGFDISLFGACTCIPVSCIFVHFVLFIMADNLFVQHGFLIFLF